MTQTGLDRLVQSGFTELKGQRIGIVCNQASIASDYRHILRHALPNAEVVAAFGPQHGIWGHTQDNMIEWEGYDDPSTGLRFYSLYGEHRQPTPEMLGGVDTLVFDLQDVGARYYTFTWTLLLCMQECAKLGKRVMVLDRPNPISGLNPQGTVLDLSFASFVGLAPLPMRHALTMGELATYFKQNFVPDVDLEVHQMVNWDRAMSFEETRLPWVMPSPNMPDPETPWVYPGMCLLEGTTLSEARGTTRPFLQFGHPEFDSQALCDELNALPGACFRPISYEPTFHKFKEEVCQGAFIHVTDRLAFDSTLAAVAILKYGWRTGACRWLDPPYEYEYIKLPIDILNGNTWLRIAIEEDTPLDSIAERMHAECRQFEGTRQAAFLYN
ncbi:MAG: DUF1343 domain-containing protein [Chthonomonas sp.]|nr:DUF1343 domain-containing protein [Chthonomonas sp.]